MIDFKIKDANLVKQDKYDIKYNMILKQIIIPIESKKFQV